jgi:dipeptidyl-peptidase-4
MSTITPPTLPSSAPSASLPEQLVRTRLFSYGVPREFTISEDGDTVRFLRSRAGDDPVDCLWAFDLGTGAERLLVDPSQLPTDQRPTDPSDAASSSSAVGITGYTTDRAGNLVVFAQARRLWVVEATDGKPRSLPAKEPVSEPRPDPTGQVIAYVCDGALRVIGLDGSGDREIAGPDGLHVTFGVADYGAVRPRGFWWAPGGESLLVKRVDEAMVELWQVADPADPAKAPRSRRYPAAGKTLPEVTLWIIGLDGTRVEATWDHAEFEYVPDAGWSADGPCVIVESRDQRTVQMLGIDPADGVTRVLSEQRDACWVQPIPGLPTRMDSGAVLSHLDECDTRRLSVDGQPVTPPGLQLRAVLGVEGDEVLFVASSEPTEAHLWSYRLGRSAQQLSAQPGVHSGVRRAGTLVDIARGTSFPGFRVTVSRPSELAADAPPPADAPAPAPAATISSLAERPTLDLHLTRLVLGPRELRATLQLPSWHRPGDGRLPVLLDPYGGAGAQRVTMEQGPLSFVSQWFAEHGFAVLVVDGSGTPGRGPEWEREVHGDIYTTVIDDQVTALREAGRLYPDLDLDRVAIRGWSFGGSLALASVLRRPDVFHAAVAGAGVTDQRLYNAPWRERFLGHPDGEHPEWYEACSLLEDAPKLTRPLLLIHGLADDNVFPVHTLRMSTALLAAGREHEVLLLPGVGHAALSSPSGVAMLDHQVRFLKQYLDT